MGPSLEDTDGAGRRATFPTTLWTVVLQSRDSSDPHHREALDHLIRRYWKPAYFYIRRRGNDVEAAKDLTQSFFAMFLEDRALSSVSPEKGRFRSFVLATLKHFLSDEYDRSRARKRGGHLNFVQAEAELASAEASPEQAFFRRWALEVMARGMERLQASSPAEDIALLRGAAVPGLSATDRKNRTTRVRTRLRDLLREEIRSVVDRESEIDEELDAILSSITPP
jgi:RNA polymerase sigma-70 factor (ECF subfamily)